MKGPQAGRMAGRSFGLTRRNLMRRAGLGGVGLAHGQGMATRGVKPTARGKPSGIPFLARFTDVAAEAGLRAPVIYGGLDKKDYILESIGCGAAFIDFDNDGWQDLLVLTGSRVGETPAEATLRLYRNNRDGTFSDVTAKAGLTRSGWAGGVSIGDYDNDGHDDIFVTFWGQNVLFRNNGDGTFSDVTREAGLENPETRYGSGCTWLDYNRDGHLDLFVSNYLVFDFEKVPKPGLTSSCNWKGVPVHCGPRGLPVGRCFLYRNNGKGVFRDVSAEAGVDKARGYCMTTVSADFDGDGWPDIYVACDSTPSLLFRNNHDGTFTDEALERGVGLNADGNEQAGMGLGIGDFNLDGHPDIFKTHFADDTNVLYRNDGKANFDDITISGGLGVETRFVAWGAGITDLDNDGFPDLFAVTGSVYPEMEAVAPTHPFKTPRVVFRNLGGGRFEELIEEAGPGVASRHSSRGCAFGDFDNDGDVDILIINLNEPPSLLRNDLSGGRHWLKVKLIGSVSNRSAIGGKVTVTAGGRKQAQEVMAQASFYSCNDQRLHFGLGTATTADVEVLWPRGLRDRFPKVPADRLLVIREGKGVVDTIAFDPRKS